MLSKMLLAASTSSVQAWFGPVVDTEYGKVEGSTNAGALKWKATVEAFQGIPYAAPPVGDFRLKPPQPFADAWAPKTRSAKKKGNICPQVELASGLYGGHEDCLYLNVYRPAGTAKGAKIPVVVWIHGGGYVIGSSINILDGLGDLYDPTNIVEAHGHVFVSMNYRLSGLGFMALPELAEESPIGAVGNYGLLDQRAALLWVQRNIDNFGGDPSAVTIQGESAGGMAVTFHTMSPGSRGLFHSAIDESGSISNLCWVQNKTDAYKFNKEWAAINGCNQTGPELLKCLRSKPADAFLVSAAQMVKDWIARLTHQKLPSDIPDYACQLFPADPWGAVIDRTPEGIPDMPGTLLSQGKFNQVPLILGGNINGGAMFGWLFGLLFGDLPYPLQHENLNKIAEWFLPVESDRVRFLELYGGEDWPSTTWTVDRVDRFFRDSLFLCPAREMASGWSKHGVPAYEYVFSFYMHTNFSRVIHGFDGTHMFELPFVFRNWVDSFGTIFLHKGDWEHMRDIMSCTWASFIKCKKPKCDVPPPSCASIMPAIPEWPQFSLSDRKYMSFKKETSVERLQSHTTFPHDEYPGDDRCDFWKTASLGWQSIRRWPSAELDDEVIQQRLKALLTSSKPTAKSFVI